MSCTANFLQYQIVKSCIAGSSGLIYAVLHFANQHPDQLAAHKQDLLTFYSDTILGAKAVLPAEAGSAYNPLLENLTQDDFGKIMLPAVLKYVKRTPEPALSSTKALLSAIKLDISSYATELVDQLLKLARGSKDSVRYSSAPLESLSEISSRSQGLTVRFAPDVLIIFFRKTISIMV